MCISQKKDGAMMNVQRTLKTVLTASLLMSMAAISHAEGKADTAGKRDKIVGAWTYNQTQGSTTVSGVAVFQADGTFITHDTWALTQSVPQVGTTVGSQGLYMTITTGKWEKTAKRTYALKGSNVDLLRGRDSSNNCITTTNLAAPACPDIRWRVTGSLIVKQGTHCTVASSPDLLFTRCNLDITNGIMCNPNDNPIAATRVWQKIG
jgi:hypothetical protein